MSRFARVTAVAALLLVQTLTGCSRSINDADQALADAAVDRSTQASAADPAEALSVVERAARQTSTDSLTAVVNAPVVSAFAEPDTDAEVVASFEFDPTYPQYLLALESYADYEARGGAWLEVLLPIRPNGTTAWVRSEDVVLYQNRFRIEIDVSDYSLTVLERGRPRLTTQIAVGTGSTPTPRGSFFTTVLYQVPDPGGPYGPFAFALSGYSDVLTTFEGGDGLIGLHGTNQPESLGTEVSHGCIRIHNDVMTELAELVPLGTPVDIVE